MLKKQNGWRMRCGAMKNSRSRKPPVKRDDPIYQQGLTIYTPYPSRIGSQVILNPKPGPKPPKKEET